MMSKQDDAAQEVAFLESLVADKHQEIANIKEYLDFFDAEDERARVGAVLAGLDIDLIQLEARLSAAKANL